jgi:acetylornithine deacetylase/succinyl-diaminopimelate desuccinylase-like protein
MNKWSDIIYGGVKVNALPEAVYAIANHRIADHRYAKAGIYPDHSTYIELALFLNFKTDLQASSHLLRQSTTCLWTHLGSQSAQWHPHGAL